MKTYKRGDKFINDGEIYFINQCGANEVIMNCNDGDWWSNSVIVSDIFNISENEFNLLCNKKPHLFTYLPPESNDVTIDSIKEMVKDVDKLNEYQCKLLLIGLNETLMN